MPTPRVTIDQLPEQTIAEDTNLFVIQDGVDSKKMSIATLKAINSNGLVAHLADTDDAHDATAISATAAGTGVDGTTVQAQLGQLTSLVNGKIDQTIGDGRYVNLIGDTMGGPLILVADPIGVLEAATKQYVDNSIIASSEGITQPEADLLYVNVDGDTMAGMLTLAGTPVGDLDAATKGYVDSFVATQLGLYLPLAGGTLTGPLLLSANPSAALGAATKQYVDAHLDATKLPLAGGTLTGAIVIEAAQNCIYLDGSGPAHQIVGRHTTSGATLGYLSWNDAGYGRLTMDPGPIYLRAGTVDAAAFSSSKIDLNLITYIDAQVRAKGVLNWNTGNGPVVFGVYNSATDGATLGTRTGYFGTNTGSDDLWVNNEVAGAHIKLMPGGAGGNLILGANNTECGRMTGSSLLLWKTAANTDVNGFEFASGGQITGTRDTNGTNLYCCKVSAAHVAGGVFATWRVSTSQTQIGSITEATTSTTAYNTGSDGRFKENVVEFDDELAEWVARIVQPVVYNWIGDPSVQVGYIAQTVAEAWPGALDIGLVTPADPEDAGSRWMMDHSKLVPVLHAAWQSSARKVEALTARVDAVEAKVKNL